MAHPARSAYDRFPTFTAHTALIVKVSKGSILLKKSLAAMTCC
jgi:hypothetical protein